jgi:hypothetical protein
VLARTASNRSRAFATAFASGSSSSAAASSTAARSSWHSWARWASWVCIIHRSTNTATFERSTHGSNGLVM